MNDLMTSLRKRNSSTNGIWEIQYRDENGKRRTITLSSRKYGKGIAHEFGNTVSKLVAQKHNRGTLPNSTQKWIEESPPRNAGEVGTVRVI